MLLYKPNLPYYSKPSSGNEILCTVFLRLWLEVVEEEEKRRYGCVVPGYQLLLNNQDLIFSSKLSCAMTYKNLFNVSNDFQKPFCIS